MISHILLLTALPACLAQVTIQGASDGSRSAEGLKISEEKGLEYTGQSDDTGDFIIRGATDGHSNFNIQGATTGGDDSGQYNIQGPPAGYGQPVVQPQYNYNPRAEQALAYKDPSGLNVNWKSYTGGRQPSVQQAAVPQYATQHAAPVSVPQPVPRATPAQHAPQPVLQQTAPLVRHKTRPQQIEQILQLQRTIPYTNGIPEQFRFDYAPHERALMQEIKNYFDKAAQQLAQQPLQVIMANTASAYRSHQQSSRPKREAQHGQQQQQPQYAKAPDTRPIVYSRNLPPHLQQLLKYQALLPYQNSANQVYITPHKPYIPPQLLQQSQSQGIRPVKENHY